MPSFFRNFARNYSFVKMKRTFFITLLAMTMPLMGWAQEQPKIKPTALFTTSDGKTEEGTTINGQAPLHALFQANATYTDGWTTYYEWRFTLGNQETPYLVRYEEDTEVTFTKAGEHFIELYAIFTQNGDTVQYTQEYWSLTDPLKVTISESILEMPNAFSPNNDMKNDTYKAKKYQSLVEFHATIYNRWGQKLYEWNDPAGEWDGTFHGKAVKQGVYFVHVTAKGADGIKYDIRKDVNLLRGYTETTNSHE